MGRLIFHINAAYAEFERELIEDRVKAGIRVKIAKTGKWGCRPLNYEPRQKICEMVEAEIPIRKIAADL